MLIVFYCYLIITGPCYIVFKFLHRPNHLRRTTIALKQGMVTLVLFNVFNIAFATGVHWKYSNNSDQGYVFGSFINVLTYIIIIAVIVALQTT